MGQSDASFDVVVFGGGVAGLWTASTLSRAGFGCLVLESQSMGSTQTIGSQGIIHGGVKYALTGETNDASRSIAEMPAIWRRCLQGNGPLDLSAVRVLAEEQYLWTTPDFRSRFVAFGASKAFRTHCEPADSGELLPFGGAPKQVRVYRVAEQVLEPKSLVDSLAVQARGPILRIDASGVRLAEAPAVELCHNDHGRRIRAQRLVFAAGPGNEDLLKSLGEETNSAQRIEMQRRPLHMVMVRGHGLPMLYGHCIAASTTPRLTVTSQVDSQGRPVWYLGGGLAETGVDRNPEQQIAAARQELEACVGWVDWSAPALQWATCRWDRAEPKTSTGARPNEPSVGDVGDAIVIWPTKLAFAPRTAELVLDLLRRQGVVPRLGSDVDAVADFPRAVAAPLPWENEETEWISSPSGEPVST